MFRELQGKKYIVQTQLYLNISILQLPDMDAKSMDMRFSYKCLVFKQHISNINTGPILFLYLLTEVYIFSSSFSTTPYIRIVAKYRLFLL